MKNKGAILLVGPKNSEKDVLMRRLEKKGYRRLNIVYTMKKYNIPIFKKVRIPDEIIIDVINEEIMLSNNLRIVYDFPTSATQARRLVKSNIKIDRVIMLDGLENKEEILDIFEKAKVKKICLNSNEMYYDLEKFLNF